MALTRSQLLENVDAMEAQGASQQEVQEYIDTVGPLAPETEEVSAAEEPKRGIFGNLLEVGKGVLKGPTSTSAGALDIVERYAVNPALRAIGKQPVKTTVFQREQFQPTNLAQKIGFGAEKIAEFLVPMTPKGAGLGTRMLTEAARGGVTTSLQEGEIGREAAINAAISGAIPLVAKGLSEAGKRLGIRIEKSLVRPTAADISDGYKTENVFKYDVGGNLQQTADKVNAKIADLSDELRSTIGSSNKQLNLNRLLDDTAKELAKKKATTFGSNTKLQNAVNHFRAEIGAISKGGTVDLPTAQDVKRATGKIGAWTYGMRDPDSTALEAVANSFYTKLKTAIESAAPQKIKAINQQLSELIPIENAVIRRLPVAERQNIVGLTDAITATGAAVGNPKALWLLIINRVLKSGRVAQAAFKGIPGGQGVLRTGALGIPAAVGTEIVSPDSPSR